MAVQRMEHVGIVVDDLADAIGFFVELGLELEGEGSVEGGVVDRLIGLEGVRTEIAILRTPDGQGKVELAEFKSAGHEGDRSPEPANVPGLRHLLFVVDDVEAVLSRLQARGAELVGEVVRYEDQYVLCYIRGPGGAIIELAERLG